MSEGLATTTKRGDKLPHLLFPVWHPSYICPPNGVGGWAKKLLQPNKFDPLNVEKRETSIIEGSEIQRRNSKRSPISQHGNTFRIHLPVQEPVAIKTVLHSRGFFETECESNWFFNSPFVGRKVSTEPSQHSTVARDRKPVNTKREETPSAPRIKPGSQRYSFT